MVTSRTYCFKSKLLFVISALYLIKITSLNAIKESENSTNNICLTKACVKAAHNFFESLDFNVNPCDDFYEYACGTWKKKHVIPQELPAYSYMDVLEENLQVKLKSLLENNKAMENKIFELATNAYNACMDEDTINSLGDHNLLDLIKNVTGGWPVIDGTRWNEETFDVLSVLVKTIPYSGTYLIASGITTDTRKNTVNIITLDQSSLGLVRNYLVEDVYENQRNAYLTLMIDYVQLLNNKRISDDQKKELQDILEFERNLAKITSLPSERINKTRMYNKWTLLKVQKRYGSNINFTAYFTMALKDYKPIFNEDFINIREVEYFDHLGNILKNTSPRVIANYISWRFALKFIWHLSKEYRQVLQKFTMVIAGTKVEKARWKNCIDFTNGHLDMLVGKLYVDEYFKEESKLKADSIINEIKEIFHSSLIKNDWMESSTKEYAVKKLTEMTKRIGYPNMFNDSRYFEKEYENLNLSPNSHFSNLLNLNQFLNNKSWSEILKPVDKETWLVSPATINAFYRFDDNSLYFPAAILQPPLFDADRPRSVNFGAAGMIIGHELTHGFDDTGKQFGVDGNLLEWWTQRSMEGFQEKSKCVKEEYKKFYAPEVNLTINGEITLGENIADNGGLKQAYMAFKKVDTDSEMEPLLPGLKFNHDQLFFLSFANMWCGLDRDEFLRIQMLTDGHSPRKFRVNGVLANTDEFLRAFNCTKESKMASKSPCNVW